ncbi:MAG: hypothetical protein FWB93_05385 [Oscillospiraceae bacterium]|nr:hypothetical protein [Oscillospiraceae bacterium]
MRKRMSLLHFTPFLFFIPIVLFESLAILARTQESFLVVVACVAMVVGFLASCLVPNIRHRHAAKHYGVYDVELKEEQDTGLYQNGKVKAEIIWISLSKKGLLFPQLTILKDDVFKIQQNEIQSNSPKASFVILKKFTSMRRDEAIFEHLLSYTLDDEFYLTHKGRKVAKCRVTQRYEAGE